MKQACILFIIILMTGCQISNNTLDNSPKAISPSQVALLYTTATFTSTSPPITPTSMSTATSIPFEQLTSTPDTRPTPRHWREWPSVPELSPTAKNILHLAVKNSDLDLHTFSKVGDCQMTSGTFLGGYANGKYPIPSGFDETIVWFSTSMLSESITAENGLGVSSVLNPMFALSAGYNQCLRNETPLDCELRTKRPAFVLIGMGTNWKPNAEISFEKYLRKIVETVLQTGALPILATKADNVEQNWKLNEAITQVAYDYDLPLVNVWRSVQDLPGRGIEREIYLTPDGWMRRNYVWLSTLDNVYREIMR